MLIYKIQIKLFAVSVLV